MEETLQPQSFYHTIKLKRAENVNGSSTTADHLIDSKGERNASDGYGGPPWTVNTFPEDQVEFSSAEEGEIHDTVNEENQTSESQYQLVLYDPAVNGAGNSENEPDTVSYMPPVQKPHPFSDRTPRVLPSIGAFTVQCASCFKWRLIPTKQKYEEIREHIMAHPFLCETAREWCPDVSCDDPPDITQDGDRLWAIDKPNIAQPPPGWDRLLRIRGEGSTKFADMEERQYEIEDLIAWDLDKRNQVMNKKCIIKYYVAPSGKRLRSMLDIQRYLDKHPEYMSEGVSLSRFSFQTPKPLQENYVRKRSAPSRPALQNDASDPGIQQYLPQSEVARITWVSTEVDTDLQLSGPALANDHWESPASYPDSQPAKRMRITSPSRYFDGLDFNYNDVNVERPHHR